jgi:extracellular factor (EF) 3-hydroxypalmitic acid methyl ester biosynthesis protein
MVEIFSKATINSHLLESIAVFNSSMANYNEEILKSGLNSEIQSSIDKSIIQLVQTCKETEKTLSTQNAFEELAQTKIQLRNATHKWFLQSYCIKRSYEKPQGYAGDYEIIDKIYQNNPIGTNIGYAIDKYYLDNPGSVSMRERLKHIVNNITGIVNKYEQNGNDLFTIFNLGSGPGRDVNEILNKTNGTHFILADRDIDALNYSKKLLHSHTDRVIFKEVNFLRIIAGHKYNIKNYGSHNIIMCIGLYDYLNKQTAVKLTQSIYPMLKPGGTLIISNWNVSNPSRTEMEWICDWYVYHRTHNEIIDILRDAGIDSRSIALALDPSGNFLVASITKPHA